MASLAWLVLGFCGALVLAVPTAVLRRTGGDWRGVILFWGIVAGAVAFSVLVTWALVTVGVK